MAAWFAINVVAAPASTDDGWRRFELRRGIAYEKRPVPGSSFEECRADTLVPALPQFVASVIWTAALETPSKLVQKHVILSRSDSEILLYDRIHAPIVSDRDVTVRVRRMTRPDGSVIITLDTANDAGPPPQKDFVRIPIVRSSWTITSAVGGTRLTFQTYSEPGGSVPAFVVRGAQRDECIQLFERHLAKIEAASRR